VLLLVQTNRNQVGLIQQDVGSHQGRIGEQTGVDVVSVFSGFVLKLGHAGQLAELGVAVEYPCQLCVGADMALDEGNALLWVNAAGKHQRIG